MRISVALCTYNGEKFLEEQLHSIFAQTLAVDEIVICDDCSTDSTVMIIQKYIFKYPNIIQLYVNPQPLKTIKNFEKAVSLTSGDYIFLCDQDDIWLPFKVEKMIAEMKKNSNTLLIFANGELVDDACNPMESTLWDEWKFDNNAKNRWKDMRNAFQNLLYNKNYVTGATVLLNKKIKKKGLPITIPNGYYHDTWFALHAAAGHGLCYMDETLIKYRIHDNQQVGITRGKKSKDNLISQSISVEDFVKYIYKIYPQFKPKTKFIIKVKTFIYKLIHNKLNGEKK